MKDLKQIKEISWQGEDGKSWKASLGIDDGMPCIGNISYLDGESWFQLCGPLYPQFEVTTGERRTDARLPQEYENRWNVYGDSPLSGEGVAVASATFASTECSVTKDGAVTYVDFNGLSMGFFKGGVRFSIYEGSNLVRVEAIASNDEHESLAYIYRGALSGFKPGMLFYRGLDRKFKRELPRGVSGMGRLVRVFARNRVLTLEQEGGAVAVFPPPHKFFFPRQLEINLGFNFYRKELDEEANTKALTLGVRHNEKSRYYDTCPNQACWPCYNAKPGTVQKMALYLGLSAGNAHQCRDMVMAYTNNDRFPGIPGYKKMANHFHMAYREYWLQNPDVEQDWEFLFKEIGVDIAYLNDFHGGDGDTENTGIIRLKQLKEYYDACRTHSSSSFMVMAGEEPNNQVPGHWNIMYPKPIYFSRNRDEGQPFVEETEYGPYYHLGSGEDIVAMLNAEKALMLLPHPRTKSSEKCPDQYKDSVYFKDRTFIGTGFRYMPADNSTERLIDGRNEETWNDMNNWSDHPKYMLGEVDTYEKDMSYDIYGDFNINYVKIGDKLPAPDNYEPILNAIKTGDVFVSTGEVIIPRCDIGDGYAKAELSWTFPMNFAEVVYSDGKNVNREILSMTEHKPFGSTTVTIEFPRGMKWARFAAWDSAGNGAFHQPVFF